MTSIHRELEKIVKEIGLAYRNEEEFPPYWVDVYLTEFHIGLEADGPRHLKARDDRRDQEILDNYFCPIIRFKGTDLHNHKKRVIIKMDIIKAVESWGKTSLVRSKKYRTRALEGSSA